MFENNDDPAFAGQVGYAGTKRNTHPLDRIDTAPVSTKVVHRHQLDSPQLEHYFNRLIGFYRRELMRQEKNRDEMAKDADIYDGDQYTREDEATLRARGQEPLVFNVTATTIDWLLGTEKRGRTDHKILPRTKEATKAAEHKTSLMKYLADVNRVEFAISRAFSDQVRVGVGWIECGAQEPIDGEEVYERYESWRNIIWDSAATELDLSDGRYMFRSKWVDVDEACGMFPDRKTIIKRASHKTHDLFRALDGTGDSAMDALEEESQDGTFTLFGDQNYSNRDRVRLIEAWFTIPVEDDYIRGGEFSGELFDKASNGHMRAVEAGRATVVRRIRKRMFVAIMTEVGLLYIAKSPYRHNRYPFTPLWCYRRDRDNMPYGVIRKLRGPQFDINKRASKALFILSSNKTIMDEGAVKDVSTFIEEVNRPDGVIVKVPGKELTINADRELAAGHLDLMARSIQMIQQVGGVTDENMGRTTNATSGRAIVARQDQGALATATIFDNLRYARQIHGEKKLSLMEQFIDKEKQFRITDVRGNPEYITVNDGTLETDIVSTKADFIIDEDDWNSTNRQAQAAELLELMRNIAPTAPQVVLMTLDLVVEAMDVPQRDELVRRIRQQTGAEDPDADPDNPDQETVARKKAQAAQQEFQRRMAEAELADKEATVAEKRARADKAKADESRVNAEVARILAATTGESIELQLKALDAAARIMSAPGIAAVADHVLAEAGQTAPAPAAPSAPVQSDAEGQGAAALLPPQPTPTV